jgi:hypothetical protein
MDQEPASADFSSMNRATSLLLISALASACAVSPVDDDDDVVELDGKADGARPAGVYSRKEATDGQIAELMLFPDRSFLRYVAGDDFLFRGTFQFTRSTTTSKRYIRFLDSDGTLMDRYTYSMNGSVVRLHLDSETSFYPMFSTATGADAWTEAIKIDWVDEAFFDWGAEAFARTPIRRADLPSLLVTEYDALAATLPPNTIPLIYRFDLHGRRGFEMDSGSTVRLFDAGGHEVAEGSGESEFDFEWE